MSTSKDYGKGSSKRGAVGSVEPAKEKGTKTVEVKLRKDEKALTLTRELIVNPPERVLRPFREAAKRNRAQQKAQAGKAVRGKAFLAKQPAKGKRCSIDLRVHAPGTVGYFAAGGMPPGTSLARLASAKGVDILGIADYYNAEYIDIIQQSRGSEAITILPGLVVCCRLGACQEVFLLCLFPDGTPAAAIYALLEALDVPRSAYGDRSYCLKQDFGTIVETIERSGAVIIPSRCDKTPYRQLAIATLVEKYGFHTFDLAHPDSPELFRHRWPNGEFTFVSFSSATALGQIGNRVGKLRLSQQGFEGIRQLAARRT